MDKNVLIILAHPNIAESNANKELIEAVKEHEQVDVYNLYEKRDDLFDVDEWSMRLTEACALVFQFPLYWGGAPYMLKKWLDEVFTPIAGTPSVAGKPMMVVTTTGSPCTTYRSGGKYRFTIDELLRPYQLCAIRGKMKWVTPVVVFGTSLEGPARSIAEGAIEYRQMIDSLIEYNIKTNHFDW